MSESVPYESPAVWVSSWRMVMARWIGTSARPLSVETATRASAKLGRYFETGSFSRSRPSSTRIMAATLVIALLWEAIRKRAPDVMGRAASRSAMPKAPLHATLPCRTTTATAPASRPWST